ncbi:hypothetical protein [Flavobacterium sp. LHD-85]|uniref:hypothetical protein n=1 Tax=Flavobacterium sp. LHD-85 TaxID=3071410 RepID=UPI0027E1D169|nr:hypothetical protein [Flavobacterium sp. LHD-85]MDQ6529079.1 hypothetical protein [Flavobacterium sp. LHD-85]
MKVITLILVIFSLKLNAQIDGKFRHEICKVGPNCFAYQFYKTGTFEFHYSQDILGRGIIKGKYLKVKDTLKLTPDKVYFSRPTKILETNDRNLNSTRISIVYQQVYKIGESGEDSKIQWKVSINDGEYIETDQSGVLILPKIEIKKIKIKDFFHLDDDKSGLVENTFYPKLDTNNIEIFVSESDAEDKNPMVSWMTKLLFIKGRKLYPITFEAEEAYLGKKKTYYKKID